MWFSSALAETDRYKHPFVDEDTPSSQQKKVNNTRAEITYTIPSAQPCNTPLRGKHAGNNTSLKIWIELAETNLYSHPTATTSNNIVIQRNRFMYTLVFVARWIRSFQYFRITNRDAGMATQLSAHPVCSFSTCYTICSCVFTHV